MIKNDQERTHARQAHQPNTVPSNHRPLYYQIAKLMGLIKYQSTHLNFIVRGDYYPLLYQLYPLQGYFSLLVHDINGVLFSIFCGLFVFVMGRRRYLFKCDAGG